MSDVIFELNKNIPLRPRCSGCKSYFDIDMTDRKPNGLLFSTCKRCRLNRQLKKKQKNKEQKKKQESENQINDHSTPQQNA
jgi:hypothetical protein